MNAMTKTPAVERHTIAVLVDNEPGVLARVIGLFSGRGYNIESLTVAETDRARNLSRITVVTSGTPMIIEQIKAQLSRLVPVHAVRDLADEGPHVERELVLIKVAGTGDKRIESLRLADIFRARVIDSTPPASTRSAATRRSSSTPSAMAVAPEAHAVETERHGPLKPTRSDRIAAIALGIMIGIAMGLTPFGPSSWRRAC